MSAIWNCAPIRAVLIAILLAVAAAFTAPAARGHEGLSTEYRVPNLQPSALSTQHLLLADEFTWSEFVRYWSRQLGSVQGVVGSVLLVAGTAFLIILSKGKG